MAGFGETMGNMGFRVVSGAASQVSSVIANNLENAIIHGKHKGVRFFYDQTSGGNILTVMAKSLVGGAVTELGSLARNTFKDLLWKDKKADGGGNTWAKNRIDAIKEEISRGYGQFQVNGNQYVYAVDHHGYRCRDALMLGIPLPEGKRVFFSQTYRNEDYITGFSTTSERATQYKNNDISDCDHLVWFDCTAIVSVDSSKNLVITPVQGRDYSRKELVSNGDINISVTGYITSPYPDTYPYEEVKKLRQILRYKGIIEVNNQILDGWDIDKIIIKDFSFPQEEGGKSVQRYSFSAVAVQPVKLSEVDEDEIKVITQPFEVDEEKTNKWADMLNNQIEALKMQAGELFDTALSKGNDLLNNEGINKL